MSNRNMIFKRSASARSVMLTALALLSATGPAARAFVLPARAAAIRSSRTLSVSSIRGGAVKAEARALPEQSKSGVRPTYRRITQEGMEVAGRSRTSLQASPLPDVAVDPPKKPVSEPRLVYGESAQRSFVKALVWRITAGVVTLVSGLAYSGSLSTALSIVGSDFVTKSGFMFAGERLWNKVKWGQGETGDSAKRSLAKAVLWRVFAASNTLVCGIFLAKDLSVASKIAGTDTIFKTALFFVNERVWAVIKWGKQYEPEYFI